MSVFSRHLPLLCSAATLAMLAAPLRAEEPLDLGTLTLDYDGLAQRRVSETTVAADMLERQLQGGDVATALRDIPGVTTQTGDGGDGELAINVRGLQDHGRVAVTIDGVRQNFARSGHSANGTFAVDAEMLREISVRRGPGGKPGAIGGSVAMRTLRADDLIDPDTGQGGELRLRHATNSAAPTLHAAVATRLGQRTDLTFAVTRAEDDDYTAPEGTRVLAHQITRSGLVSVGHDLAGGHRISFTASSMAQDYVIGHASTPRDTDLRKATVQLDFTSDDAPGGWAVDAGIYRTTTRVTQQTLTAALAPTGVFRSYDTQTTGARLEARRGFDLAGALHDVTVSFEAFQDTATVNDPAGSLTPSGTREVVSLGVADSIALGAATLTFGLSLDHYALKDATTSASGTALSPRVAFDMPLGQAFHLFASAALTYRPPTLNESLVAGFHPPPATFEIRPNPNLRPERATSFELGLGYSRDGVFAPGDLLDLRVTAFRNTVRDYIELEQVGGIFNNYFQYQNVARARIDGLEVEARYDSDRVFASVTGQILRGTNQVTGLELSRVAPARLVLTAGIKSPDARRQIGARLTLVDAKDAGSLPAAGWQTLDLFLTQQVSDSASFGLTLNNVTDHRYTPHLSTQPAQGFNAKATLTVRF